MKDTRRFKKGDLIILSLIGIVLSITLVWSYFNFSHQPSDSLIAVITRDGKQMAEIDLKKVKDPQYFTYEDGIKVTIVAENGSIRFLEADCPDKICVKTGTLNEPAERAVCLPSKTIVKIKED